jgi:hypothetical protein
MKTIDLILILSIGFIFYLIYKGKSNKIGTEGLANLNDSDQEDDNFYLDELAKFSLDKVGTAINPIFNEGQFHNDYRDTITAFNNIAPSQKQIFNHANIPVQFINPSIDEVKYIIKDFMKDLNKNIITDVSDYRNNNTGWDESTPDKKVKSGWDKQMQSLGLPTNLYPEPAKKSKIRLIAIDHVERYDTEDETKYVCFLFLQKKGIKDQMSVKISFVLDKKDVNEDRNFFDKDNKSTNHKLSNKNQTVVIEEIYILGFMTIDGTTTINKTPDDFYNFKGMENEGMLDQATIMKELIKKQKDRTKHTTDFNVPINGLNPSLSNFNGPLDKEQTKFRNEVPKTYDTQSYQVTQTIFDDFTKERTYS